ncbi:MAG: DUF3106 domain-containing protein [bacterium]|nr:DUF3106 domain-containing protein [bacterium]
MPIVALALLGLLPAWRPECASAAQRPRARVVAAQAARVRKPRVSPRMPSRSALDRFRRMTPKQRRNALRKLSPQRRRAIEQRLRQLDKLTPEQQRQLRQQYRMFEQLPPDRQARARQLYQRFNRLEVPRRAAVTQAFRRLRRLTPAEQAKGMESKRFRELFSADEQKLLREMLQTLPSQSAGQWTTRL